LRLSWYLYLIQRYYKLNADGQNPENKRAWLWVAVTPLVAFFQVMLSRSTAAAIALLGENFAIAGSAFWGIGG
jgi:hypothetical protein